MDENEVMQDNDQGKNNAPEKRCGKCGALIIDRQQFCPNCGKRITDKDNVIEKKRIIIAAIVIVAIIAAILGGIKINEKIKENKLIEAIKKDPNTPHEHVWTEPTCTEPAQCTLCGRTKGKELGHNVEKWERVKEPTCENDGVHEGICTRCGEVLQKPITKSGHRWYNWKTVRRATCNEKGLKERTCSVCGDIQQEEIPKLQHEWELGEIITAARWDKVGKRKKTCKLCGKTENEDYYASAEEFETTFKEDCGKYAYNQIARNPDDYKGKLAVFKGEVIQVLEDGNMVHMRIDITRTSWGYTDTIYVVYQKGPDESRILEDDIVTIWGKLDGLYTYESIMGAEITLPLFKALYLTVN